ncbi:MAG TPA: NAD(P)H-binding protein [Woeseiaceae bacterium]|nr:NAD(P)H-binding protein [Woeseiaceae bacterium]
MKVALLGGTGFVGTWLVDALLEHGHEPALLVRPGSEHKVHKPARCLIVTGDVTDAGRVGELVAGADSVVYNVGILRESPGVTFEAMHVSGVELAIAATREAGCSRFVLMSANGAAPNGTPYQTTKYRAEQALVKSGIEYTIFRPSVIFGDPRGRDEIATRLYRQMIRPPLPAVWFHTGLVPDPDTVRLSPVAVEDVAEAFARGIDLPECVNRTLALGGGRTLNWKTMLECIAAAVGRRKLMLPMPLGVMSATAALGEHFPWFPVTRDQLTMLAQGNIAGPERLETLLGRPPVEFAPDALGYLNAR